MEKEPEYHKEQQKDVIKYLEVLFEEAKKYENILYFDF